MAQNKKNEMTEANSAPTNDNMTDELLEEASLGMANEDSFGQPKATVASVPEDLAMIEAKRSMARNTHQQTRDEAR